MPRPRFPPAAPSPDRRAAAVFAAVLVFALAVVPTALAADPAPLVLVFDASGSMWGQIAGTAKIVMAKKALGELIAGMPDDAIVGLVAYGHRKEQDCADVETLVAPGPLDRGALEARVEGIRPKGKTPITGAALHAFASLAGRPGPATVVLLTDGLETCGGDPCAAVRAARARNAELVFHVVGFDVAKEDVSSLECAAQAGGGLYVGADDAAGLASALAATAAAPEAVPDGGLVLEAVADGALIDVSIRVRDAATGAEVGGGRTYAKPETNPRRLPLPDGRYQVEARPVAIQGDVVRRFEVRIEHGGSVEKRLDFSTGELRIAVTSNGVLSDATYRIYPAGGAAAVASGRTYTQSSHNPATKRLAAATYDVEVESVEVAGAAKRRFEGVDVDPEAPVEVRHEFPSGTLVVGAVHGDVRVDATVRVVDLATGRVATQARTYTGAATNPKTFVVTPGSYRVELGAVRLEGKPNRVVDVEVRAGETTTETVDFGG